MTRPARSRFGRRARQLGIAFAVLVVIGIAGEIWLRLDPGVGGSQNMIRLQGDAHQGHYVLDPELGALVAPSRHDVIETPDYTYTFQTDHAGFPNPEPWPSQVDVAVFGNSLLDGLGVGMDGQFTTLLEHRLGERTVLNFALPGGGTGQEYGIYRRYARPLQPKLVIAVLWPVWDIDNSLHYGRWQSENRPEPDFTHYRYTYNATHANGPPAAPSTLGQIRHSVKDLLGSSYLLRAGFRRLKPLLGRDNIRELVAFPNGDKIFLSARDQLRLAKGIDLPDAAGIRAIFFQPLEQMRTDAEAQGARFVAVLVPSKEEIYGALAFPAILRPINEVRSGIEARRLPVLDLYPMFRELGQERPPFYRADMHLNPYGNQIVADAIAKWIEDEGIFTSPAPAASARR